MFELPQTEHVPADGFFLERLDAFMQRSLADIKAFSLRENKPFEETRKHVAEWHSRYLLQSQPTPSFAECSSKADRLAQIRSALTDVSRNLETLHELSGIQSFLLAVDPSEPNAEGFLGGSLLGREFWRDLRNGGDPGARTFRHYCLKRSDEDVTSSHNYNNDVPANQPVAGPSQPKQAAKSLKTELYDNMRKALRTTSGNRNAEMKWTNPDRLDIYGVALLGWPADIPAQNPSSLKSGQNKRLLELLENGTMNFVKTLATPSVERPSSQPSAAEIHNVQLVSSEAAEPDSFSWAIQYDGIPVSQDTSRRILGPSTDAEPLYTFEQNSLRPSPEPSVVQAQISVDRPRKRPRDDIEGEKSDSERVA